MTDLGNAYRPGTTNPAGVVRATTAKQRSAHVPAFADDYILRVLDALDMTPPALAAKLDLDKADLYSRYGSRANASEWHIDPFWQILSDYLNMRLAGIIAVKDELDRKQRLDARAHQERERLIRQG